MTKSMDISSQTWVARGWISLAGRSFTYFVDWQIEQLEIQLLTSLSFHAFPGDVGI